MSQSATYTRQFFTFTHMPDYRLLLACGATFISTFALRAEPEGHEIANHSWSHPNFGKMSQESVRSQVQRTDDAIRNATGKRPTLLRPPYGSITEREKRWIHDEFGYDIILWDVDPLDWKRPGPAVVRNRILKETRPGSIVLSHDIHP